MFWLDVLIYVISLQAYPCIVKCIRVHSDMPGLIGIKSGGFPHFEHPVPKTRPLQSRTPGHGIPADIKSRRQRSKP